MDDYLKRYKIVEFSQTFNSVNYLSRPQTVTELRDALLNNWNICQHGECFCTIALPKYTYECENYVLGYKLTIESFEPNLNVDILNKLVKEYQDERCVSEVNRFKKYGFIEPPIQGYRAKTFDYVEPESIGQEYQQIISDRILSDFIKNKTNSQQEKETNFMNGTVNFMNGMFGKIESGKCRLSVNGAIAIQTSGGNYKTYNVKTGRLTNCSNFVFDIGDDFFFLLPTSKVKVGDIIIVGGKPKCVIEVGKKDIKVINYENSTVDTIIPERHVFMGNTYFYGKIVSMFGQNLLKGKTGTNKIMQLMLMKEMFGKNGSGSTSNPFGNMLPFMMLGNNGLTDMFGSMFEEDEEIENPFEAMAELDGEDEDVEDPADEAAEDEEEA